MDYGIKIKDDYSFNYPFAKGEKTTPCPLLWQGWGREWFLLNNNH